MYFVEIEDLTEVKNNEEAEQAFQKVQEKIDQLKKELADQKAEADAEEKKMQALVDESRDALVCCSFTTHEWFLFGTIVLATLLGSSFNLIQFSRLKWCSALPPYSETILSETIS